MFGGHGAERVPSGVRKANLESKTNTLNWEKFPVTGASWRRRYKHEIDTVDGKIFMFGGYEDGGEKRDTLHRLLLADGAASGDSKVLYHSDASHYGKFTPLYKIVNKKLVLINRSGGNAALDDVKFIDLATLEQSIGLVAKCQVYLPKALKEVEAWTKNTQKGVESKFADGELQKLLKVMGAIHDVKEKSAATDLVIETSMEVIAHLKQQGVDTTKFEKALDDLRKLWFALKKEAPKRKEDIKPDIDKQAASIRADVEVFTKTVKDLRMDFDTGKWFEYDTGSKRAYEMLFDFFHRTEDIEKEFEELRKLCVLFEFPRALEGNEKAPREVLNKMKDDMILVKNLWDVSVMVATQFDVWKLTLWADIDTDMMEDQTKAFKKDINAFTKFIKLSKAHMGVDGQVKNFLTVLPLIAELHHPSMRPRHWEALKQATKKEFELDDKFAMKDLLELELFNFEDDVGEIVNRAQKEEKMEQALAKIHDIWEEMDFHFSSHRGTDLMICAISEEDNEVLEDHQVQVQNMMGSRYLATFEKEVTSWQSKLSNVSEVLGVTREVMSIRLVLI
jgi:dynein heavy chain